MSLAALQHSVPVGAIMMINAILFTGQTAMGVVMLKKVNTFFYMDEMFTVHIKAVFSGEGANCESLTTAEAIEMHMHAVLPKVNTA